MMVGIPVVTREVGLTGKRRYRVGWWNKVILQVEVKMQTVHLLQPRRKPNEWTTWRDATTHEAGIPNRVSAMTFIHISQGNTVVELIDKSIKNAGKDQT